jgi:iron complex outermembrane receptor protein
MKERNYSTQPVFCFKIWSRKKNSVLLSLSRVIKIGVLCISYSLIAKNEDALSQTDSSSVKEIQQVEITGRRSEIVSAEIARMVTVIQRDEIEKAGISGITDLLEYISNLDIRQRGVFGIQADASIRGSSFDHIMVLINGINVSDPQTGHYNLDIPLDPESIERIEVLEGPAARVLGPDAFMGAVNIITRKNLQSVNFSQSFGMYDLIRSHADAGFSTGAADHFISAGRSSSSGYMKDTDHKLYNFYYRGGYHSGTTAIDFQAGYQNKKFGAAGFYTPKFPNQYEETGTLFSSLRLATGNTLKISPVLYWRHKNDRFVLFRDNPGLYQNYHLTDLLGSQLSVTWSGDKVTQNYGFDVRADNIYSTNIGFDNPDPVKIKGTDSLYYTKQYQRINFSAYAEYVFKINRLSLTGGLMVNRNTGFKNKLSVFPGLDANFKMGNSFSFFGSYNRALHLPTFTDLFYRDPVNQGNLNLVPNRINSFEAGIRSSTSHVNLKLAVFYNRGRDVIEWLWSYKTSSFKPVNVNRYESAGVSSNLTARISYPFPAKMVVNYTWLTIHKSIPDSVAKYYNLKHKLSLGLIIEPVNHLSVNWNISYQDRFGSAVVYNNDSGFSQIAYKPFWLMDLAVTWTYRKIQLFTEASNLLNKQYIDAGSANQPGIWVQGGVRFSFPLKRDIQ